MRFKHSRRTQRSGSTGKRRKRTQRIRGFAHGAGTRSVEAVSDVPPAAPIFSLAREKIGEKRTLGYVWRILRMQFRQALIFSCCEHTNSPYGRYSTRRLLRYTKFASSYDLISAVKTPCIQNLQGSANLPESCRGRYPHRPAGKLRIRRKLP